MPDTITCVGYSCPLCLQRVIVLRSSDPPQGYPLVIGRSFIRSDPQPRKVSKTHTAPQIRSRREIVLKLKLNFIFSIML